MYILPTPTDHGEPDVDAITQGPFVYAVVRPGQRAGKWRMIRPMALNFTLNLVLALIVALMMKKRTSYGSRVLVAIVLGLFAGLSASLPLAIWMELPPMETLARLADPLVSWLLAGMAMAAIIKSPQRKIFAS